MNTWGERIKAAREAANLTQEQLGKKLGVTGVTIMRYEKNQRQPRLGQLSKIALALNTTVYEMMGPDWDGWRAIDVSDSFDEDSFAKEKAPAPETGNGLTDKDRRDIARDLERIMETLDTAGDLQFDGDPMSDEARESIRAAVKLGLEAAKLKNKERFTPKKYRKE